jgi:hypothetical protein
VTPKLLLALALVGAMHGQTPPPASNLTTGYGITAFSTGMTTALSFPRNVTFNGPGADESDWLTVHCDPNCHGYEDAYAPVKVKLTVRREPTVAKKPDGSWEITFAGKAEAAASFFNSVAGGTPMTPEMIAASKIMPPAPLTVLWPNDKIDADKHAWLVSEAAKYENKGSIIIHGYYHGDEPFFIKHDGKRYEFGLRSDGCVVWRERK